MVKSRLKNEKHFNKLSAQQTFLTCTQCLRINTNWPDCLKLKSWFFYLNRFYIPGLEQNNPKKFWFYLCNFKLNGKFLILFCSYFLITFTIHHFMWNNNCPGWFKIFYFARKKYLNFKTLCFSILKSRGSQPLGRF